MTDKVICPWCGTEMSDGWHENGLGRFGNYLCQECFAKSPDVAWPMGLPKEQFDMLNKAAAMRRYTPPIKPMTLEEVWKEEDPVWVEGKNGALYIGDFYASMSAKNGWDVQTLGSAKPLLLLEDYYGRTWRCWERKPTDEERSAAEWRK